MTHNAKNKKRLISITSFLALATLGLGASFGIVSCSSNKETAPIPPNTEIKPDKPLPPKPPKPEIPNFSSLDKAIEWLWNDNIVGPIKKYYENPINKNNSIDILLLNDSKPFNSLITLSKNEFESNNAFTRFKKLVIESSIIGDNFFQITKRDSDYIPGYESSPLYGPWERPEFESGWTAQLKWTRTK